VRRARDMADAIITGRESTLSDLYAILNIVLESGNQNQRLFAINLLKSMRFTEPTDQVIHSHAQEVLKHQTMYVETYPPRM
jgi:hypothetical protein